MSSPILAPPSFCTTRSPTASTSGCPHRSRIEQDPDSVTVNTQRGQTFTARAAVVAAPINTWANIEFSPALSDGKQQFTSERLAGRDVKIWIQARNVPRYFASLAWGAPLEWLSHRVRAATKARSWSGSATTARSSTLPTPNR